MSTARRKSGGHRLAAHRAPQSDVGRYAVVADGDLFFIEDKTNGRLGRSIVSHDPRNRAFPARGVLFAEDAPIIRKSWWCRHLFDQQGPSCTMQSAAGVLHTSPFRIQLDRSNLAAYDTEEERHAGYLRAQNYDPWEGSNYDGSSTDAPFKMLREDGRIREWRWCFGLNDVLRTLSHHGPVSIGTLFYSGMDEPLDPDGLVEATGDIWGGHAYELFACIPDESYAGGGAVDWMQSWGARGPRKGRYRMSWATLERLLAEQGEAVTVVL